MHIISTFNNWEAWKPTLGTFLDSVPFSLIVYPLPHLRRSNNSLIAHKTKARKNATVPDAPSYITIRPTDT